MKRDLELSKKLNLNYLNYTNLTITAKSNDLPTLYCKPSYYPDFLALSSELGLYNKTNATAVCFYEFDNIMDGQNGLANAIYYANQKQLEQFKKRFAEVKYFIMPDFTQAGDGLRIDNENRLLRARLVAIWLMVELNAYVLPNITTPDLERLEFFLDGYQECDAIAISTKGHMQDVTERNQLRDVINRTVSYLHPKAIIVYDVCGDQAETYRLFEYAAKMGVRIIVPSNTLQIRNMQKLKGGDNNANK